VEHFTYDDVQVWCLVLETVAPGILYRENIGTDEKCHLLRAVHFIRSVYVTPTSMRVTGQTTADILCAVKC